MADVQIENGYVKIANELLDAFLRLRLTSYQTSIFFAIVRKTYGFNKREDQISLSQFEELTGIARSNALRTLRELDCMNIINIRKETHMRVFYGVQKDYDKWLTVIKPDNSLKPQLLSNQIITVLSDDNKTVVKPENNKRHKRHITKDNIVQKLSSKETLEAYFLSLPEYQNLSSPIKLHMLTFIDKIRQGNKTKVLAKSRVDKAINSLREIIGKYGEANLIKGIEAVFAKEKKDGFSYVGHDPTGYVRAVAKRLHIQATQKEVEQKAQRERDSLMKATGGELLQEIESLLNK